MKACIQEKRFPRFKLEVKVGTTEDDIKNDYQEK